MRKQPQKMALPAADALYYGLDADGDRGGGAAGGYHRRGGELCPDDKRSMGGA